MGRMRAAFVVATVAAVCIVFQPVAHAQGVFTQIDVPGATRTFCTGVDSIGNVVGSYYSSVTAVNGFILSQGVYTTIDYQGENTVLGGMNDNGQIVGSSAFGFVYDLQTGTFTEIKFPNAFATIPTSINNSGTIAGYIYLSQHASYRGFELVGSTYEDVDPPGTLNVYVFGVSNSGKIVGYAESRRTNTYYNFLFGQGTYGKLIIPNAPGAEVSGVSPAGDALVGAYAPSAGVVAGFVYQNQVLQTLQFPGSTNTTATAINSTGEVVGYFYDANGIEHGFTWTP